MFPILGGRLLKGSPRVAPPYPKGFPILGGRLLKRLDNGEYERYVCVSNPWREAIEVRFGLTVAFFRGSFQSLEGGY